jgi:MFS family permease
LRLSDNFAALRERSFRRVFLASATSTLGDFVAPVAVAFAVLELTRSPSALGIVLAARTLSLVVFVLVGGVWADRISRQRLMVIADLLRFVSQGVFAALLLTGAAEIWHLAALQAVNGMATAFFQPASTGLIPQTVSSAQLQRANALISLTRSASSIAGPVIAGVLVASVGAGWAIAVDAATFAVSALFLTGTGVATGTPRKPKSFRVELAEGWHEVCRQSWLRIMLLVFASFQLLIVAPWMVLGPAIFDADRGGAAPWAAVLACYGAGAVGGATLALKFHPRQPLVVCCMSACFMSLPLLLLGLSSPTVVIAAASVCAGVALVFSEVLFETTMQENVPEESLSRVAAYDWVGSVALQPVGLAVVGSVAGALGARSILVAGALGMAVIFVAAAMSPFIQAVGRAVPLETSGNGNAG